MNKRTVVLALAPLVLGWALLEARAQLGVGAASEPVVGSLPAHRFERVAEGVYFGTATGSMVIPSSTTVIVNDDDVLAVDPGITPAVARALVEDIKTLTNKPLRFAVDSHYHYDHAHGNQIFGPEVSVIGHDMTRTRLLTNVMQQMTYATSINPIPERIEALKKQIAAEKDPQQRAALERQVAVQQLHWDQEKEITVTPPNMTFSSEIALYRGSREIRIIYLGRGHTDTDVVVFLPKERIVVTGDLMESVVSYAGDAFVDEWPATLEKLAALDFDTVLPGHGVVFKGKDKIRVFQAYLRDLSRQVSAFRKQGVPAEEAAKKVDLTAYSKEFPAIRGPGVDLRAVNRMYDLAANPNAPVR
jgi:cyclase